MRIETWIAAHEQELVDDIAALIRIRSVAEEQSGTNAPYGKACRQVLDAMLEIGRKYGFEVSDCDGYAGEICWGGWLQDETADIGIWGHLDVVPEGDGWQYPPYELTREGDFLIGRGVQDNKGPVITALYAMRFLKENGLKPKKRFRLIFGCNEERGMDDVEYFLEHRKAPDLSFVADCGFPVCRGEKGLLHLEIEKNMDAEKNAAITSLISGTVINSVPGHAYAELISGGERMPVSTVGISGHAAFPEGTVHAAKELCGRLLELPLSVEEREWIAFLEKLCSDGWGTGLGIACEDEESGRLTCNAGIIRWENGVCRMQLDIRFPVTVCSQELLKKVDKAARKYGFVWKTKRMEEPFLVPEQHPFVETLMRVYSQEMKDKKLPYIMGGGTYAKKIPRAVGFGPGMDQHLERIGFAGSRGCCHSVDEAQSLMNLKTAMKIYADAIAELESL